MTVEQLIEKLQGMPQKMEVRYEDSEFSECTIWEVVKRPIEYSVNKRDIVLIK